MEIQSNPRASSSSTRRDLAANSKAVEQEPERPVRLASMLRWEREQDGPDPSAKLDNLDHRPLFPEVLSAPSSQPLSRTGVSGVSGL